MTDTTRGWFVTGTDTGVGKTLVSGALLRALRHQGRRVAGMKPVASGCITTDAGLRNEDALILSRESSERFPYELVNPYAFAPAIAPHVAAAEAGVQIDLTLLTARHAELAARVDRIVVEGAGGWRVPIDDTYTLADLAIRLGHPVVLVVGLRLGCLNHALLSAEAILACGLRFAGWVGNAVDPDFARPEQNIATLEQRLPGPCLGLIPRLRRADIRSAAEVLEPRVALLPDL